MDEDITTTYLSLQTICLLQIEVLSKDKETYKKNSEHIHNLISMSKHLIELIK